MLKVSMIQSSYDSEFLLVQSSYGCKVPTVESFYISKFLLVQSSYNCKVPTVSKFLLVPCSYISKFLHVRFGHIRLG
jgi:hypothetical protein